MGNVFKHMKDVDVVKNITEQVFSKVEEVDHHFLGTQVSKAIRIEDTYDLIPYQGCEMRRSITGEIKVECILWSVQRYNDDTGMWNGVGLSFRDAILFILNDWTSMTMVDNALENMSYENDQMEEELNPIGA